MRTWMGRFDPMVGLLGLALSVVGLYAIYDAGFARSIQNGGGMFPREFVAQCAFLVVSLLAGVWVSKWPVHRMFHASRTIWILTLIALVGVLTPLGYEMGGASRWYRLGPITIQPAEFAKLAVALYLAAVLANRKAWPSRIKAAKHLGDWLDRIALPKLSRMWPLVWVMLAVMLIAIEPDLGTAAVAAFMAWAMFAVGGITRKSFWIVSILGLVGAMGLVAMEPYRLERILHHGARWHSDHLDDVGFQSTQSELAMASGGLLGVGPGAGRVKYIIPAPTTDFIPATVAEEFGLVGWLAVVSMLAGLVWRLCVLALEAPTRFGSLFIAGIASWIGIQAVVNLMMANGALPAIGIPLPFISSGGSSLLALWLALGLTQAAMQPVALKKTEEATPNEADRDRWGHGRTRVSRA